MQTSTEVPVKATIVRDMHVKAKVSRIGQPVTILRKNVLDKVWVKLEDGTEAVWRMSFLKIIK